MADMQQQIAALKGLGTVVEMKAAADAGRAPTKRPKSNGHIHLPPNFSALDSVPQLIDLAAEQSVTVLGASNYYDYSVYAEFAALAQKRGIFPIFGLEVICLLDDLARDGVKVNDPGNPGRIYFCGKGLTRFAPMNREAKAIIDLVWKNDTDRMTRMIDALARIFASHGVQTGLTLDAVKDMIVRRHGSPCETVCVQERHVAKAFQEVLFERAAAAQRTETLTQIFGAKPRDAASPVAVQNDLRSHLMKAGKAAFVEEALVTFQQGYRLVLALGGIPCYPTLADGTLPICGYEDPVEKLIETLHRERVYSAEFIPIRNKPEVLSHYVKAMRAAGLVILGGTEHNTLDLLPIEPTCLKGAPVPEDVKDIFWEGACVTAAHQFLALHGECGFVDAQGEPNPAYKSDEERIAAFRRLGAAVMETYFQKHRGR